jgi:hypothetical protein
MLHTANRGFSEKELMERLGAVRDLVPGADGVPLPTLGAVKRHFPIFTPWVFKLDGAPNLHDSTVATVCVLRLKLTAEEA